MFSLYKILNISTSAYRYADCKVVTKKLLKTLSSNVELKLRSVNQSSEIPDKIADNNGISSMSSDLLIKTKSRIISQKSEIDRELIHKDDPDRFGVLSGTAVLTDKFDHDIGDKEENEVIGERRRYLSTKKYAEIIKVHLKNKHLKDALDVLEIKMLNEDKAKPETYIYNLLISGCAAVGYTKKAFKLYNDMKRRGLKVKESTYTSLFNACANSPWPEDGLKRATHLRELMIEKGYIANITNYNAMIKAFGRCNDLQTAFMLVDEMIDKKLGVTISTMNFLLQACLTDKNAGFRHALLVWRKILQMRKKPDTYSFNLMLQCVKECGLGNLNSSKQLLDNISIDSSRENGCDNQLILTSKTVNAPVADAKIFDENFLPNLLSKELHIGKIVDIKQITKPEHRLLLLGGASGVLKEMYMHKAVPNIKTFTQLLQVIPSTIAAETAFLKMMKQTGDKVDVCFFNMLMKKRVLRFEYDNAKTVLKMIEDAGLKPDIITYGILSMTCQTKYEARDMLDFMNDAGYRPNSEILGSMLHSACKKISFGYVKLIMETIVNEEIVPNKEIYNCLEIFHQKCWKNYKILKSETTSEDLKYINRDYFIKLFPTFSENYKSWLQEIQQKYPDCQHHPWDQYRKPIDEGFEGTKIFERKKKIKKRFIRAIS